MSGVLAKTTLGLGTFSTSFMEWHNLTYFKVKGLFRLPSKLRINLSDIHSICDLAFSENTIKIVKIESWKSKLTLGKRVDLTGYELQEFKRKEKDKQKSTDLEDLESSSDEEMEVTISSSTNPNHELPMVVVLTLLSNANE